MAPLSSNAGSRTPGQVLVGTSGWSYPDWAGAFYPEKKPARFDELEYFARYFDCVEVNSSFYRPPAARSTASWLRRTPGTFQFTFKLHQRFTHEGDRPWTREEVDEYRRGIDPVREAGRLGAVLVQFPWSFRAGEEAFRRLADVKRDFGDLPLVVEVRHVSWIADAALDVLPQLDPILPQRRQRELTQFPLEGHDLAALPIARHLQLEVAFDSLRRVVRLEGS